MVIKCRKKNNTIVTQIQGAHKYTINTPKRFTHTQKYHHSSKQKRASGHFPPKRQTHKNKPQPQTKRQLIQPRPKPGPRPPRLPFVTLLIKSFPPPVVLRRPQWHTYLCSSHMFLLLSGKLNLAVPTPACKGGDFWPHRIGREASGSGITGGIRDGCFAFPVH